MPYSLGLIKGVLKTVVRKRPMTLPECFLGQKMKFVMEKKQHYYLFLAFGL